MLKDTLSIAIITYNRAPLLQRTLRNLMSSRLSDLHITVLNNASTDATLEVCDEFASFPNFKVITNKFNIGGDANIMRAYEQAYTPYVWIVSDDDYYDFSELDDLEQVLQEGKYDLIQVGCTDKEDHSRYGGKAGKIHDFVAEGYTYFRISSNTTASIVKVSALMPYIIRAYQNIVNHYPHMPFLISMYEQNAEMYITKNQILHIYIGATDHYSFYQFLEWWLGTSKLVKNKADRKAFLKAPFEPEVKDMISGMILTWLKGRKPGFKTLWSYYKSVPLSVKIKSILDLPSRAIRVTKDKRKYNN